jgi:hypothetical protein
MATGAAIASSANAANAAATSNAYAAGVAAGTGNTTAAYQAGVAAGATGAAAPPPGTTRTTTTTVTTTAGPASYAMGASYAALPAGAMAINKNGQTYYLLGNTWFQPAFGANGVHYTVVGAP